MNAFDGKQFAVRSGVPWLGPKCLVGLLCTTGWLLLLTWFLQTTTSTCAAQSTGTVRMLIDPGHNFQVVVDSKYRMQRREVELGEGLHHFALWAPERVVVDTAVFVVADRTTDLVVHLPYSTEYTNYRNALVRYQNARKLRVIAPVVVGAGILWSGLSYAAHNKAHDQLQADRALYDTSTDPGLIAELKKERIPAHNAAFERARKSLIMGSAFTALGAGLFWYVRHRTQGLTVPVFEDKERIRFEGLTWIGGHQGGVFAAVSIPLSR